MPQHIITRLYLFLVLFLFGSQLAYLNELFLLDKSIAFQIVIVLFKFPLQMIQFVDSLALIKRLRRLVVPSLAFYGK